MTSTVTPGSTRGPLNRGMPDQVRHDKKDQVRHDKKGNPWFDNRHPRHSPPVTPGSTRGPLNRGMPDQVRHDLVFEVEAVAARRVGTHAAIGHGNVLGMNRISLERLGTVKG